MHSCWLPVLLLGALAAGPSSAASALKSRLPPAVDPKTGGKLWVVLAAGSDGYYNYRHQADICHAYQIVKKHGVPEENIIVFMRDDIANNDQNPNKGVIINKAGGPNVYKGVGKDYVGANLTPELFLDVLAGKEIGVGSKKTLKTGKDDSIFVVFADHGAPGLVEFGDSELKATDLNRVLKQMHKERRYKEMVLYVEACESGSMFQRLLPKNLNIFATTASNSQESSYACYFDEKLETYLGDCYSVNWMEDTDQADVTKETLHDQFVKVRNETTTSHVMEFGDLHLGKSTLGHFVGNKTKSRVSYKGQQELEAPKGGSKYEHAVPQYEVTKKILQLKIDSANDVEELQQLQLELDAHLESRAKVQSTLEKILTNSIPDFDSAIISPLLGEGECSELTEAQFDECYYPLADKFMSACFPRKTTPGFEFVFHSLRVFASACLHDKMVLEKVLDSMDAHC